MAVLYVHRTVVLDVCLFSFAPVHGQIAMAAERRDGNSLLALLKRIAGELEFGHELHSS